MTLQELYRLSLSELRTITDSPALDSRIIIENVLGLTDSQFILSFNKDVSPEDGKRITSLIQKRKKGIPVAYITGKKEFYGHTFLTENDVLIPQPDTETLVEEAVRIVEKEFRGKEFSIFDVCAGTGCIGLSVSLEAVKLCSKTSLTLSDISSEAFKSFSENAENLLSCSDIILTKHIGNMFEPVENRQFSMIVSNPPYIETDAIRALPKEVLAEPVLALDGGKDGLDFVRIIAKNAMNYLEDNGYLLVEIGFNQGFAAKTVFEQNGWHNISIVKDLGGRDRVVKCSK